MNMKMKLGKSNAQSEALASLANPALPIKRLQVNIPEDLHKRFKLACLHQDLEMTDVVKELVKNWLETHENIES